VASRRDESTRVAQALPLTDSPLTQEDTCSGGLGLGGRAPVRTSLVVEPAAPARDQQPWPARLAQAGAGRTWRGLPSPSDAAPGRRA
jgi:hypothetical protein